ncbi:MAG: ABC transporter substrate-binding protein [Peptoniphilaceae bacterium]
MKNKKLVLGLMLALLLTLTACGGKDTADKGADGEDKEKILYTVFDKQGEGTNFDTPWWNRGDLYKVISYRGLFQANPELTEFKPDLAESYTMSDDGLSYEFVLKDGLKWSDGKDLTGDDVKFSIEGSLKGAKVNGIYSATFNKIVGAEEYKAGTVDEVSGIVVDGNKISLKLTQPVGNMINILSQFTILPRHGFEGVDMVEYHTADFWKNPITNGMYKVEEISTDSYIVLVPNENYEKQAPKIGKVVVNIMPSESKLNAVVDGQADFFNSKAPNEIAKIAENKAWDKQAVDTLFYYYLVFNFEGNDTRPANEAIKDPKVRQAIYYAIDRESLAKNLFPEIGEVASLGVPERDNKNFNSDLNKYEYNPEKAKELLKEANYDTNQTLEFRYYMADQSSVDLYNSIAANLADVGIKLNVQKFSGDATQELFDIRNYDIALKGLSAFGYDEWYGEYASTHGNFPKLIGSDGEYDALYNDLLKESDPDKKSEILKSLQAIEEENLDKMPIFMLKNMIFTNSERVDTKDAKFGNPWFAYDMGFENWEMK